MLQSRDWQLLTSAMDRPICHVLYINRNVRQQRVIRAHRNGFEELDDDATVDWKIDDIGEDIQPLLDTFGDGASLGEVPVDVAFQLTLM